MSRQAEASAYYAAAMERVATTPPPKGQRYPPGARVRIADDLGPHMSHFPGAGKLATVHHTYAHAFQREDARSLSQYSLDIDGHGRTAWYDEEQLSAV